MSAKKPMAKKTFQSAAGKMPVLRPAASAAVETKPAETETLEAARQIEANRAVILRLVETVKGL
ncbi:MAG: hypothetical protein ABI847_20215 [Anaerolineales bacterium]